MQVLCKAPHTTQALTSSLLSLKINLFPHGDKIWGSCCCFSSSPTSWREQGIFTWTIVAILHLRSTALDKRIICNDYVNMMSHIPVQYRPLGAKTNPGLQMHLKLPSSFIHIPFKHMLVVVHSSWSRKINRKIMSFFILKEISGMIIPGFFSPSFITIKEIQKNILTARKTNSEYTSYFSQSKILNHFSFNLASLSIVV